MFAFTISIQMRRYPNGTTVFMHRAGNAVKWRYSGNNVFTALSKIGDMFEAAQFDNGMTLRHLPEPNEQLELFKGEV